MSRLMFSFLSPFFPRFAAVAFLALGASVSLCVVAECPKALGADREYRAEGLRLVQDQIGAARAYIAGNNLPLAQEKLQTALETAEDSGNQTAISVVHRDLAYLDRLIGNHAAAAKHSKLALAAAQEAYGNDSILLLPLFEEAISDCMKMGDSGRLPGLLEQIIVLERKCGAPENVAQLANLFHLSKLYQGAKNYKDASVAQQGILNLTTEMYGKKSPKVLTGFASLAQLMFNDKNYVGAETVCQTWLSSVPSQDTAECAKANFYMGLACHNQKKFDVARKYLQVAWDSNADLKQKANAGIWLMQIDCSMMKYDSARRMARDVFKLAEAARDPSLCALALEYEAIVEKSVGNSELFESLLTRAAETRRRTAEWTLAKADLNKLSTYFESVGQSVKASSYAAKAAALPN